MPSGAAIGRTGFLTWNVPADQATGSVSFTVTVSDTSNPPLTASQTISIDVFSTTVQPPVLATLPSETATIGHRFSLNVGSFVWDPNTPALTLSYTLGRGAPAGASIGLTTGVFTWTPASDQPTGPVPITIVVSNNESPPLTTSGTLTVNVAAAAVTTPSSPTPSPTPRPTQTVIVGEVPLFRRKLNKKGKPTGKAVLAGFTLDFGVPLNPAAAGNAANYQIDTVTKKKVQEGEPDDSASDHELHGLVSPGERRRPDHAWVHRDVPDRGSDHGPGRPDDRLGGTLTGNAVFTISKGGKSIGSA